MSGLTRQQFELLSALKCIVAYNEYGGYCVPIASQHRIAARAILSNHVYEPKTIAFLTSNWSTGDIVHAGTYFGDFLPAISAACPANSTIWAFEPNVENFRCAQITMLINGINNVVLTHAGLGARRADSAIQVSGPNGRALGGASRIIDEADAEPGRHTQQVEILTIDEAIPEDRNISIIQLDVEGFEERALSGGMRTIERCKPLLVLEVLQGRDFIDSEWFVENILGRGYAEVGSVHGNAVFTCTNLRPPGTLKNMDPVLTRESIKRL